MSPCACGGSECVKFWVPGEPVSKERPRGTRSGHHYTPKKTLDAEAWVRSHWPTDMAPFEGPVRVDVLFALETRRGKDIDNLLKTVQDSGNKHWFADDKQIEEVRGRLERGVGKGNAWLYVHITPLPDEDAFWAQMWAEALTYMPKAQ